MEHIRYNKTKEPVVLFKALFDSLLATEYPAETIALYSFYYYTAKWQNTNRIKAVTSYAASGLRWSQGKVRKIKKILVELGLVRDVKIKGENNSIQGWYLELDFILETPRFLNKLKNNEINNKNEQIELSTSQNGSIYREDILKSHPNDSPQCGIGHSVGNRETNALKTNNSLNALNKKVVKKEKMNTSCEKIPFFEVQPNDDRPIRITDFDQFYEAYPKKADQGKAFLAWEKLCKQKNNDLIRPTMKTVRNALELQKNTLQWQNPQFIPLATTWINQKRWLDEIEPMNRRGQNYHNSNNGFVGTSKIEYPKPEIV